MNSTRPAPSVEDHAPALASLSVCIATYRRPALLASLLDDLRAQHRPPQQIVVVDNDPDASARGVVDGKRNPGWQVEIVYAVQPVKNISLTRNCALAHANGQWIAFIDDDERAPPDWLATLESCAVRFGAEAVLAPVTPVLPPHAPGWIRRGAFYNGPRMPTGTVVPRNVLRIGNALLSARCLAPLSPPFDPAFGLTGGEDGDMLMRLAQSGTRIIWCDEAVVREPVPDSRLSASWLLRRALRGGQDYARHFRNGRLDDGKPSAWRLARFHLRNTLQMTAAALLAVLALPGGRHRSMHWLMRAYANFGKLSTLWGWHYREYA